MKTMTRSSDCDALIVGHGALQVGLGSSCIVNSGATCHMCNESQCLGSIKASGAVLRK